MPCVVELFERLNRLVEYRREYASSRRSFSRPERRGEHIDVEFDFQWLEAQRGL